IAVPNPLTCLIASQTLNTAGSSTGANFDYAWTVSNGGNITLGINTPNPTVNAAGDYNLLITNTSNGCTATSTVTVQTNNTLPPAEAGPPGVLTCTQPTFSLVANPGLPTANLDFHWDTQNGQIGGNPNAIQVTANQSGVYSLTVTDPANGCTNTDMVTVTANQQPPAVTLGTPNSLTCTQTTANLSAMATSNTLAYQWQTVGGQFVSGNMTAMPVVDAAGAYSVTVTDGQNGCTGTASLTVTEDIAAPNVQAMPVPAITCVAPTQTISAQNLSLPGNFTYNWIASNGGNILSGATSLSPVVNAGGDFSLTTTNTDNGCTSILPVIVGQNTTMPTANAGSDSTLSCSISALVLNGSGTGANNLIFTWTATNGGHFTGGAATAMPAIDHAGDYELLVTNPGNGCTATDAVQILNDANTPQANAGPPATLTCSVLQTTLSGTASMGANFSYQWTASLGGNLVNGATTLTPQVDHTGAYQLVVTNAANGCVSTSTVTVGEDVMPPVVDAGSPVTLDCSHTQLALTGTATGANNLTIQWSTLDGHLAGGATSLNPQVDQGGSYMLLATNPANGCTATDNVTVAVDTLHPVVSASVAGPLNCVTLDIPVQGTVNSPAGGFTAAWTTVGGHFSGLQNTLNTMVDEPGVYVLTVQNTANGCASTTQTNVLQDIAPPAAIAGQPGQITCDNPSISLNGTGSSTG
ncbi:MAG: hypothetical protein ABIO24_08350, partial [Saprospiraceae bacterium]